MQCSALGRGRSVRSCRRLQMASVPFGFGGDSVVSVTGRRAALEHTSLGLLWTRLKLSDVTGGLLWQAGGVRCARVKIQACLGQGLKETLGAMRCAAVSSVAIAVGQRSDWSRVQVDVPLRRTKKE